MVRFQTDRWLEALLRPFVLADPNSGIYFELPAPDLRFALLVLAGLVLWLTRRRRSPLPRGFGRLATSLVAMFIVWTAVVGNGRYFIAGLLLAGVLLTVAIVALPGTRWLRGTLLAGTVVLQAGLVADHFHAGQWALARWSAAGSGLPVSPGVAWPAQPATFLTTTNISFSMLAPQGDPRSRWTNVGGLVEMGPMVPEYPRFQRLLADPQPKYLVVPTMPERVQPGAQPAPERTVFADQTLARHGLRRQTAPCWLLPSQLTSVAPRSAPDSEPLRLGFWLCPLEPAPVAVHAPAAEPLPQARAAVAEVERRCPRWFPAGAVTIRRDAALWQLFYPGSDVRLYVETDGNVLLRHLRALNPTRIGSTADVAAGRFALDCRTLPGRYRFPWERE